MNDPEDELNNKKSVEKRLPVFWMYWECLNEIG